MAESKKKAAEVKAETEAVEVKEEVPVKVERPKERTIFIPPDYSSDRNDLYVSVNGRSWLLRRGEPITVPNCVAEVVERSLAQDKRTLAKIHKMQG